MKPKGRGPNPNAKVRDEDGELNEAVVRGIITNPVYAGVGEYPKVVSDETWLEANEAAIEVDGIEQYLTNVIFLLEQSFKVEVTNKDEWRETATGYIKKRGTSKFLTVFLTHIRDVFRNAYSSKREITLPILLSNDEHDR